MSIGYFPSRLFAAPLVYVVTMSFVAQPPTIAFAVVEAVSRRVRHPRKRKDSPDENVATYKTYRKSATLLADAIAHDREQEQNEQQPQQKQQSPALDRPLEGIYMDKPVLRGRFHRWGAFLYPPLLGLPLWLRARSSPETASAALLFNLAVESILIVSARLHTVRWKTLGGFQKARNLDFCAIYFGIATFYSSWGRLMMGGLHPILWKAIEAVVWSCAMTGAVFKSRTSHRQSKPLLNGIIGLVQGWATLPCVPSLWATASWRVAGGLVGGAVFGTLGALAYIFQWPKNDGAADGTHTKAQREIVFGPHEMFHLGTMFMFGCFWLSMWSKVSELV